MYTVICIINQNIFLVFPVQRRVGFRRYICISTNRDPLRKWHECGDVAKQYWSPSFDLSRQSGKRD